MKRVLVDTVGFLALWNSKDPYHDAAFAALLKATSAGSDFLTTSYILLECGNSAARTPFRKDVIEVREQLLAAGNLVEPTQDDLEGAWAAYQRGEAANAGIVDHVSFAVMRRLGITDAFTNDKHFRAAGFKTLF